MNLFLSHIDWSPIIYGVALFLSVLSMAWKIKHGNHAGFFAELAVVGLILMIHGGSVTGGFAATIAGLLSGWFIPLLMRIPSTSRKSNVVMLEPPHRTLSDWEIYVLTRRVK